MHIQSLLLGALASMATAQTFTECDPTKKSCPNNPAMKEALETDFKKGVDATAGWKTTAGKINYGKDGAEFTISKKGESPTIQSNTYLFFGRIEVKMKAAAGKGIISSIVLESDDLDEVDWEFLGTDTTHVQMNYFGKGNTTVYDRMLEGSVANPQQTFHTYALDWKPEALTWEIDGVPVRTLKYADAVGGKNYPQTPSNVRIGIWAGGDPDNKEGVIQWAGGKTDYSKAPFTMVVESVKITNYNPGTEYKWKDQSGSWQSIEVLGKGDKSGAPANSAIISSAAAMPTGADDNKGVGEGINVPSTTGSGSSASGTRKPVASESPCTESHSTKPTTTPVPFTNSTTGTPGSPSDDEPCSCGAVTITVTASEGQATPPSIPTTLLSLTPIASPSGYTNSSTDAVSSTSDVPPPPPVTIISSTSTEAPAASPPPAIVTDTNPPPVVPIGSIPPPSVPVSVNGTTPTGTGGIPLFTGAAVPLKGMSSGILAGILGVIGVMMV